MEKHIAQYGTVCQLSIYCIVLHVPDSGRAQKCWFKPAKFDQGQSSSQNN